MAAKVEPVEERAYMIAAYQGFFLLQLKNVSPRNTEVFVDSGWQVVLCQG